MGKEVKTNAMRILDKNKIPYEIINYECDERSEERRGVKEWRSRGSPDQ